MVLKKFSQPALNVITIVAISVHNLLPFAYVPAVYAVDSSSQKAIKQPIAFNRATNEFEVTLDSDQDITYLLAYRTEDTTQVVNGTWQTEEGQINESIYAGTCSNDDCVPHFSTRGILKYGANSSYQAILFTIANNQDLQIDTNRTTDSLELTEAEINWLETGEFPSATPEPITTVLVEEDDSFLDTIAGAFDTSLTDQPEGQIDTYVTEVNSCMANSLNGCVITDKDDYSPYEVVLINGYGFEPNTDYTIIISSSDEPAVNFSATITTDDAGAFSYSYQLDGIYRPDYTIQVFDLSGALVAETTFTDAPISGTSVDSAGANDEPGQKDLTQMSVDYSGLPSDFDLTWNWDELRWTGNNTGDACALFDTNGNGFADNALCVTVAGNPGSWQATNLYSCDDDRNNRCTNSVGMTISGITSCTAGTSSDDPFAAGDEYPNDTKAECTLDLIDIPGAELLDVCSYPSQQPNSDPSDCIVFQVNTGKLEIIKVLDPAEDSGLFNLQIDGVSIVTDVGDGGTTGEQILDPDTYAVGEAAGTNTNLANYSSSIECRDLNGAGEIVASSSDAGPTDVTINEDDDIVCIITNSLQQGTLTVNKVLAPAEDSGLFNLLIDDAEYATNQGNGGTTGAVSLQSGDYVVSETAGTDTVLDDYTAVFSGDCDEFGNVTVNPGQDSSCTITNMLKTGSITVIKNVVPNDSSVWDFLLAGPGDSAYGILDLGDEEQQTISDLLPGNYDLSETTDLAYVTSVSCDNGASGQDSVNFDLSPDETITCTFTNSKLPTLTLQKTVNNNHGGTAIADDFQAYIDGSPINWNDPQTLDPGSYTASEDTVTGYQSSGWTGDCAQDGSTTLAYGDTKTCTITNSDIAPTLTLVKQLTLDDGGTATASAWTLTANGTSAGFFGSGPVVGPNQVVADVTYTLSEDGPTGYEGSAWQCNGGTQSDNTITLSLAQDVTCIITNDDIAPTLTLIKEVINDDGGMATASAFQAYINGNPVPWGQAQTLNAGNHTASESGLVGYSAGDWGQDCSPDGSVSLLPGDNKTCTITNDDLPSTISGKKFNDINGDHIRTNGTTDPNLPGWTIRLDDENSDQAPNCPTGTSNGQYCQLQTDEFGNYSFTGLAAGTYRVSEVQQTGWLQTRPNENYGGQGAQADGTYLLTIGNDEVIDERLFGNQGRGTVTVTKNVDSDGDGEIDVFGSTDWVWDLDGDESYPTGTNSAEVSAGLHVISELQKDNYHVTSLLCDNNPYGATESGQINIQPAQDRSCVFTNTRDTGTLIIDKITNPSGSQAEFTFDIHQNQELIDQFTLTDQQDPQSLTLTTGAYSITEQDLEGWDLTSAVCTDGETEFDPILSSITISKDKTITCTFTNTQRGSITVAKSSSFDVNTQQEFTLSLGGDATASAQLAIGEQHSFNLLTPGTYSLTETVPTGWELASIICDQEIARENGQLFTLEPGQDVYCEFTNNPLPSRLLISKTNNHVSDTLLPGDDVVYTITITAADNAVTQVIVTDLLPTGFTYQSGSWTANSSTRGDLKTLGITTEPTYASPGAWQLGDMEADEIVTLTYIAAIANDQEYGTYPDLAWATGTGGTGQILAQAQDPGFVDDNFVGTSIKIDKQEIPSSSYETQGQVLGASTELPATGANSIWLLVATLCNLVGVSLIYIGKQKHSQ